MSSVLAEFLSKAGERIRAEQPARETKLADWLTAIRKLMAQLTEWVRAADPNGLIEIDDSQSQQLLEAGLGQYSAPRLALRFEAHRIWVIPKARNVMAFIPSPDGGEVRADGLAIITDYPPTGDQLPAAVYNLYWVRGQGADRWFIRYSTAGQVEVLDRERFERVLVNMLQ